MWHQNLSSLRLWACQWRVQFYDRQTHTPRVHVNISLVCFISFHSVFLLSSKYWPLTSITRSGLKLLRMIPSPVKLQNWLSLPGSGEIFNLQPAITTPPDVSTQQSSTSWRERERWWLWSINRAITEITLVLKFSWNSIWIWKGHQSLENLAAQ